MTASNRLARLYRAEGGTRLQSATVFIERNSSDFSSSLRQSWEFGKARPETNLGFSFSGTPLFSSFCRAFWHPPAWCQISTSSPVTVFDVFQVPYCTHCLTHPTSVLRMFYFLNYTDKKNRTGRQIPRSSSSTQLEAWPLLFTAESESFKP